MTPQPPGEFSRSRVAGRYERPKPRPGLVERRRCAAEMRARGESFGAIAAALGVSEATVRKDIAAEQGRTGVQLTPECVVGLDGRRRRARREHYERVPMDEDDHDTWLYWDSTGAMYFDAQFDHPAGLFLCRQVED